MEINKYIRELLYRHECVIVPGLGAFITHAQPAVLDEASNTIQPASKKIAFNGKLQQNDALLIHHVAQRESCNYTDAEQKVRQFVQNAKRLLDSSGIMIFPEIGRLALDQEGKINFSPAHNTNYLASSFGLKAVHWHKTYADDAISATLEKLVEAPPTINRRRSLATKMALNAAAAIIIISLMVNGIYIEPLSLNHFNILPIGSSSNVAAPPTTPSRKPIIEKVAAPSPQPKQQILPVSTMEPPRSADKVGKKGYYIVVASFDKEKKALDYMKKKGLNAQANLLDSGTGRYRVAIFAGTSVDNAIGSLKEYQQSLRPDAWLLEQR
ncbi:MAG: hypothetical protein SFW35_13175 [Chitinophagales bacterium]|nr:hypothetical protein [Chitinophagales bacterium]